MPEPKYRQIADDLRRRIESGELKPGAQLPTETDLGEHYGASRNTIRDAIKMLITPGLVETRAGQGTFVIEKPPPFVTTLTGDPEIGATQHLAVVAHYVDEVKRGGRAPFSTTPEVKIRQADREVADALGMEVGEYVVSRYQQRFIDDIPWSLQTSFYPMSLVGRGATRLIEPDNIEEGVVHYLAENLGIRQVGYLDLLAVRPPNETEIGFFRLPDDGRTSVCEVFRFAFDEDGHRIRLTITVYPSDRNQFAIKEGRVPEDAVSAILAIREGAPSKDAEVQHSATGPGN